MLDQKEAGGKHTSTPWQQRNKNKNYIRLLSRNQAGKWVKRFREFGEEVGRNSLEFFVH